MVSPAVVLVPLYIYPLSNAWDTLTTSLAASPDQQFTIIINPDSGPGASPIPSDDYISALTTLNTYPNVQPVCYIRTGYASRDMSDVLTDIDTCASWATYPEADIHVSGVFFDEAPADDTDSAAVAYMQDVSAYARAALPSSISSSSSSATIIFNPGTQVATPWYAIADSIVAFEDSYRAYSTSTLASIPEAVRDQTLFIIYGFDGDAATQAALVADVVAGGLAGLFVSTQTVYSAWSDLWAEFCAAVGAA